MASVERSVAGLLIVPSAANVDTTLPDQVNESFRGMRLIINISGGSTASTKPTFKLQGKPYGGSTYYNLWTAQATTAVQVIKVLMYPGASTVDKSTAAAYTKIINDFVPSVWRFASTNLGAGSAGLATWSAAVDLLT